ncbi:integrin beta-PS-like [Phymastichus coffea]|uniref:integrin beta-PS-like n=1 Tax=Phymastichus coffea TaxID=108790 RepID=UPI00273C8F40|nr:integrin beta-PS-like [Phymastichus coffea]
MEELQRNYENVCAAQQTCSQCLQTPHCVWCSELNNETLMRCATRNNFLKEKNNWCSEKHVVAYKSFTEIIEDKPLHSKKGKATIQIQPQRMRVVLRQGEEQKVIFKYSKAEDYPVDLYYLMDLSASMEPYKEQLSKLGSKLADAMRHLTSNFRLGFGSFVDKVTLPMTSTHPDMLKSPCNLTNDQSCAPPYGYKHQMPLTEDWTLFMSRVREAPVSGNLDGPEGGFDAIMQAIVCTDKIGWRKKARHLLVFSTDATVHIAGDGRLAGIIEPNDGLCHLDQHGYYTHSLLQDYPSISQINRKIKKHNINIIFVVPEHMNATYQLLTKSIGGSFIGILENDINDVVSLVSKQYEKLIDSVILTDDAPKAIDVRYFSKCFNENSILRERKECDGVRVNNVAEFDIILKAVNCPSNISERHRTIKISPRGLIEHLELEIEILCDCSCEMTGNEDGPL